MNPKKLLGCVKKRAYSDSETAIQVAKKQLMINPDKQLYVYFCDICNKYHMTSKDRKYSWKIKVILDLNEKLHAFNILRNELIEAGILPKCIIGIDNDRSI